MNASGAAPTYETGPDGLRPIDYAGHVGSPAPDHPDPILARIDRALALLDEILARLDGEDTAREVTGR